MVTISNEAAGKLILESVLLEDEKTILRLARRIADKNAELDELRQQMATAVLNRDNVLKRLTHNVKKASQMELLYDCA